jgi:hypothetical protein
LEVLGSIALPTIVQLINVPRYAPPPAFFVSTQLTVVPLRVPPPSARAVFSRTRQLTSDASHAPPPAVALFLANVQFRAFAL